MKDIVARLEHELWGWVHSLDIPSIELALSLHSYEYIIKKEIIEYFTGLTEVPVKVDNLMKEDCNLLDALYDVYMDDDSSNIHSCIEDCLNNWVGAVKCG